MGNLDEIYVWVLILLVMGYFFVALRLQKDAGTKNRALHRLDDDWTFGFEH
jgi:hypothetical protein